MCGGSVSNNARSCRDWLSSKCVIFPYDDRIKHVPIPSWYTIHVGTTTVHHTHVAHSVKGIVFRITCGHFGARKLVKLARACTGHTTPASALHKERLMNAQLPTQNMSWPSPDSMSPPALHG